MNYSIIIPKKDLASMTIYKSLINEKLPENVDLNLFDNESIYLDNVDKDVNGDILVFATRHRASSGKKSFTCHFPGNWGRAEFGGRDNHLCLAPASLLKSMFGNLKSAASVTDYEVTLEATHHGPSLSKPAMFIELGSSEHEWKNIESGKIIAMAISKTFSSEIKEYPVYFGLGGTHYANDFTNLVLNSDVSIGHICPKYQLDSLNEEALSYALSRNFPNCDGIVLDWSSLGSNRSRIISMLSSMNLGYSKTSDLLKQPIKP